MQKAAKLENGEKWPIREINLVTNPKGIRLGALSQRLGDPPAEIQRETAAWLSQKSPNPSETAKPEGTRKPRPPRHSPTLFP